MSDEKAIVTAEKPDIEQFGKRDEILALGRRFKTMLPGGEKLKDEHALALGQAAILAHANPFRGELYPMVNWRGELSLVEGYKLLVRWAKRQCDYDERYGPCPDTPEDAIGVRCYILRADKRAALREYIDLGASFAEAREMVETYADGIVTHSDMHNHKTGKLIPPPQGWTWAQVARKRALKNALNQAYGMPSLTELGAETWDVDGVQTQPQDWQGTEDMRKADAEAAASYSAMVRQIAEDPPDITATEAIADLYGDEAAQEYADEMEPPIEAEFTDSGIPEPETEQEPPTTPEKMPIIESWAELHTAAVSILGYTHANHVKNTLKKIFNGQADNMTYEGAWAELIDHQAAKAAESA